MATGKLAHLGCKFVSSKVVLSKHVELDIAKNKKAIVASCWTYLLLQWCYISSPPIGLHSMYKSDIFTNKHITTLSTSGYKCKTTGGDILL